MVMANGKVWYHCSIHNLDYLYSEGCPKCKKEVSEMGMEIKKQEFVKRHEQADFMFGMNWEEIDEIEGERYDSIKAFGMVLLDAEKWKRVKELIRDARLYVDKFGVEGNEWLNELRKLV